MDGSSRRVVVVCVAATWQKEGASKMEVEIDDGLITECVRSKAVINLDGLPLHHDKRRPSRTTAVGVEENRRELSWDPLFGSKKKEKKTNGCLPSWPSSDRRSITLFSFGSTLSTSAWCGRPLAGPKGIRNRIKYHHYSWMPFQSITPSF